MRHLEESARARGFHRLVLNATAQGEPLYRRCGYREPDERALSLDLGPRE